MKRVCFLITVCVCLLLICVFAISCADDTKNEKTEIVCTSFVVKDWIENILPHGGYSVTALCAEGRDMHNYQPTASDIAAIHKSDLVVYIGGESDSWVNDVQYTKDPPTVLRLMDFVESENCDDCHEGHEHESGDEHIWLSFENALLCVEKISETLKAMDREREAEYSALCNEYSNKINQLFDRYKNIVSRGMYDTLVFADRFPFVYLVKELGLKYEAAFDGCSSEMDASFETVIYLAKAVDEKELPCVLVIEGSDKAVAKAVVANAKNKGIEILALDSMQVKSRGDSRSYLDIMESNAKILSVALGVK